MFLLNANLIYQTSGIDRNRILIIYMVRTITHPKEIDIKTIPTIISPSFASVLGFSFGGFGVELFSVTVVETDVFSHVSSSFCK